MNHFTIRDKHTKILKYFRLLLFLPLLCLSCEEPMVAEESSPEKGAAEDHSNANLIVSVYQLAQTPFLADNRSATTDACTRLNFAIYDQDGSRVKQVNQTSDMADFGQAYFQLPEGTYQLVVVAHNSNGNPTMTELGKIKFTNAQGFTDTFIDAQAVTVSEQPKTLSLSLRRIVSLCRFIMTDEYPEDLSRVQFQYKGGSGAFDAKTGLGSVNSIQTVTFDASQGVKQFDLYTFLHDKEGTIHLVVTAYSADNTVLLEKEFDIPMKQNCISCVSGPLFSGTNTTTHSVTVSILIDTTWNDTLYYTF